MEESDNQNLDRMKNTNRNSVAQRIRDWYRGLPDKKRYLEFITALLTIPVLLTVFLSNVTNLQNQNRQQNPTPTSQPTASAISGNPTPIPVISGTPQATPSPTSTPGPQCTPGIGPITIVYPEEGDTVKDNPLCLEISRRNGDYCSVAYSYRINNGAWSAFSGTSVCMFDLTPGTKKLDLRVRSTVNDDESVFSRTFIVAGDPTPTPATQSGTLTQ